MSRRAHAFLLYVAGCLAVPALPYILGAQGTPVDVLIRGGDVVDGSGAPGRVADVGIRGDRILFIGDATRVHAVGKRTIDAQGLMVAPGFIDPHTHTQSDLSRPQTHANLAYLMQGVTTVMTDNDGGGPVDTGTLLTQWTRGGIGTNAGLYVPEGAVREKVMGMSAAAPTPEQMQAMEALVAQGMNDGAFGMSTGLYYAPGSYATTDEIIQLAKVAAQRGGIYDSHLRDESSYSIGLIGAVEEALRIGREAHIPIHISHIKALGADVWGQSDTVIALVDRARREGMTVTADQYPYLASGSSVEASLVPRWAEAGGRDSLLARIANHETRVRLVKEMQDNLRRRGGAASLLMTAGPDKTILGKNLEQIATGRREPPIDAALQIIQHGGASVASFNMKESDLEKFMVQPWVMTGSDGSEGHPRKYGTFPLKLHEFVLEKHLLTWAQAVHASSALAAEAIGIRDRGELKPRNFADVVVFDTATINARSTYEQPTLLATGVKYVLVNGVLTIDEGRYTGALAGRALRKGLRVRESVSESR